MKEFNTACFISILLFSGCISNSTHTSNLLIEKQKGIHHFGKIDTTRLPALIEANFDWITLVGKAVSATIHK